MPELPPEVEQVNKACLSPKELITYLIEKEIGGTAISNKLKSNPR